MMTRLTIALTAVLLFGGFATQLAPTADSVQTVEAKNNDNNDKKDKREDRRARRVLKADSYINPDIGLATFNPDVNSNSECETPDQFDTQRLSNPGAVNNNVHNDACLFKNGKPVDTRASFQISGVGVFSACPDPDGGGPKTAFITNNGQLCTVTGYQTTGMDGDQEYHARINNSTTPGLSVVTFCDDPFSDGCADAKASEVIKISWTS